MEQLTFIDLFSGCGGLSEGFLQTKKFNALAHVEWEEPMVKTLRNRLEKKWGYSPSKAKKTVLHFDIQKTKELINGKWKEDTRKIYESTNHEDIIEGGLACITKNKKVDLIIGGPPCQAYSIAGRAQDKDSMKNDYRNYLFESFIKVVDHFKPRVFVFENVPGMLSAKPGGYYVTERIYEAFKKIGYTIKAPNELKSCIYSASDFNVPQKRRRVILIGKKNNEEFDLKEIYNSIDKQKNDKILTVRDAIFHLNKPKPYTKSKKNIDPHTCRFHNNRDIKIFKEWIKNKMNNYPLNQKLKFYKLKTGKDSNHAKYRNLEWDKPSPTIVAHLYKDGLMFIHPKDARSITVKEAAILQSFPDDFEFLGPQGYCYKMIGNAVPVNMSKAIAIGIYNFLTNLKS